MTTNNAKHEFETYLKRWAIRDNRFGNGVDIGCGTCRIDDMITSIDQQSNYSYAHAQFVWDCRNLELFNDGVLDFIFSSHCLEDFDDVRAVFVAWWKKLKVGGVMLLLLPDMEKCDCQLCNGKSRYWSIEDYAATGQGNPSHKTNVGKRFMAEMLDDLKCFDVLACKVEQQDTIPHNVSSSIDFVIRKLK